MDIVISSGHGKYVRGAAGPPPWGLDEVDEARKVVNEVAGILKSAGHQVYVFHDDVSTTQSENLDRIVDYHNSKSRELDVSVHFNCYETTSKPMGTEVLYYSQDDLAREVSAAIARAVELPDRGPKLRTDLAFLNNTDEPAILIETCFVDSSTDAEHYRERFEDVCWAIAGALTEEEIGPEPPEPPQPDATFHAEGKCSHFGGPADTGVSESEGLAFIYAYDEAPHLFLLDQPSGTTGLARRLNPNVFYVACRWDYSVTPKSMLANPSILARVRAGGHEFYAWPADWGPHEDTGRVADLSPGLMEALGLETDDEVEVFYPA